MFKKNILLSSLLLLMLLIFSSTIVFAAQTISTSQYLIADNSTAPEVTNLFVVSTNLKRTGPTTATFQYKAFDKDKNDITKTVSAADLIIIANVYSSDSDPNIYNGSVKGAETAIDPSTGTCTITYNFTDSNELVQIILMYKGTTWGVTALYFDDYVQGSNNKVIKQITFDSNNLTKIDSNASTFKYSIMNEYDKDITALIPASQIETTSSIDSSIELNPSNGTGTIKYKSSDADKPMVITLQDKVTGITGVLSTEDSAAESSDASHVARLYFTSNELVKIGTNTATFKYKILDQYYNDITKTVPASDIAATASVDSAKADISLEPSEETGTITYNFTDTNKQVIVTLMHKDGVGATSALNMGNLDAEGDKSIDDLKIAQIFYVLTDAQVINSNPVVKYRIFNKYGTDITKKIPVTQIAVSTSINSSMRLDTTGVMGECTVTYKPSDYKKVFIIKLTDKVTGVSASLNIADEKQVVDNTQVLTSTDTVDKNPTLSKIAITTQELVVNNGVGYAAYRVEDQSGNEITESSLADNLIFKCDVGKIESNNKGLLTIIPNDGVNLLKLDTVTITASDPITGVSADATLTVSK